MTSNVHSGRNISRTVRKIRYRKGNGDESNSVGDFLTCTLTVCSPFDSFVASGQQSFTASSW